MTDITNICVYCGSGDGRDPVYLQAARSLGKSLAEAGIGLVYGGGSGGLMGALADSVMANGGTVTGIIPQFLVERERAAHNLSELIVTNDMHERKWAMFERADAFVALPGGIGTLEELIEVLTWAQLGRHDKPVVIADIDGFWRHLSLLLDHMNAKGFLHSLSLFRPLFVNTAEEILPSLLKV